MPRASHADQQVWFLQHPNRQPSAEASLTMKKRVSKHRAAISVLAEHMHVCFQDFFKAPSLGLRSMLQEVLHDVIAERVHCDLFDLPQQGFDEAPNLAVRAMLHETLYDSAPVLVPGSRQRTNIPEMRLHELVDNELAGSWP